MNNPLQAAADELHRAVKHYWEDRDPGPGTCAAIDAALAAYERAKAEAPQQHSHPWPHDFQLAQWFHETYERLAPSFGYETRKESAKPWEDVPEKNKKLMTAVCREILIDLSKAKQQPAAKPVAADWIDSVAREFSNWLENEGCGVDLFSDCRDIVMKHAPAQDSREITAKELLDWMHANFYGTTTVEASKHALFEMQKERAAMAAKKTNLPL